MPLIPLDAIAALAAAASKGACAFGVQQAHCASISSLLLLLHRFMPGSTCRVICPPFISYSHLAQRLLRLPDRQCGWYLCRDSRQYDSIHVDMLWRLSEFSQRILRVRRPHLDGRAAKCLDDLVKLIFPPASKLRVATMTGSIFAWRFPKPTLTVNQPLGRVARMTG